MFFLPETNELIQGEYLCTLGSVIIFISQTWKCYRTAKTNVKDPEDLTMRWENIEPDMSGFQADLWEGIGGLGYFIGTWVYYFTAYYPSLYFTVILLWTIGGFGFLISGIILHYRYYIRLTPAELLALADAELLREIELED